MPRFAYTARAADGQTVTATIEAASRKEAARLLSARSLRPISLQDMGGGGAAAAPATRPTAAASLRGLITATAPREFSAELQLPFLQALVDLIGSGLPAGEGVRLLSQRLQEPRLRGLCAELWEKLSGGLSLSGAMEEMPSVFAAHSVNLIAAGEATGNLREVLERLIQHYTTQQEMKRTLTAALAYPVFICTVALGVILFFVFFLLPRLQTLLTSLGGQLPWATKVLVGLSGFILHYGLFVVIAIALLAVFIWRWRQTASGRLTLDTWLLKLPVAKRFVTGATIHNLSQTLAVLLENGVTTAEALRMTERTIVNKALQNAFHDATGRVLEGESLSGSFAKTGYFPPLVIDRLSVGESTGQLAPSLRGISHTYQSELTRQIRVFTQVVSSGVLLCAFAFVAFIAYAIVSAVFQVSASFKF